MSSFPYPAYIGSGTMVGRKPILSRGGIGEPVPRIALDAIGIPLGMPPGPPGVTAGAALMLVAGNAEPTWLKAGAADAQLCGTDSMPSEAARPTLATLPISGAAKTPVPELKLLPSAYPAAWT
jgi:hypothetical protein